MTTCIIHVCLFLFHIDKRHKRMDTSQSEIGNGSGDIKQKMQTNLRNQDRFVANYFLSKETKLFEF